MAGARACGGGARARARARRRRRARGRSGAGREGPLLQEGAQADAEGPEGAQGTEAAEAEAREEGKAGARGWRQGAVLQARVLVQARPKGMGCRRGDHRGAAEGTLEAAAAAPSAAEPAGAVARRRRRRQAVRRPEDRRLPDRGGPRAQRRVSRARPGGPHAPSTMASSSTASCATPRLSPWR